MKTKHIGIIAGILCTGLLGCKTTSSTSAEPMQPRTTRQARAQLVAAPGSDIRGEVVFRETERGVHIEAKVEGLPSGAHGIHIHEIGKCERPDFTSAGDHFDPDGNPHGPPGPGSHAGDLGNLSADTQGIARLDMTTEDISLDPQSKDTIIGRALIIHADPDDLVSQPSGNAGDRIACGIIRAAR